MEEQFQATMMHATLTLKLGKLDCFFLGISFQPNIPGDIGNNESKILIYNKLISWDRKLQRIVYSVNHLDIFSDILATVIR